LRPASQLNSEDLPTFGRPTITTLESAIAISYPSGSGRIRTGEGGRKEVRTGARGLDRPPPTMFRAVPATQETKVGAEAPCIIPPPRSVRQTEASYLVLKNLIERPRILSTRAVPPRRVPGRGGVEGRHA